MLFVGMLDVSPLGIVLFHQPYLHGFYLIHFMLFKYDFYCLMYGNVGDKGENAKTH